jgi:hypothetical protein
MTSRHRVPGEAFLIGLYDVVLAADAGPAARKPDPAASAVTARAAASLPRRMRIFVICRPSS